MVRLFLSCLILSVVGLSVQQSVDLKTQAIIGRQQNFTNAVNAFPAPGGTIDDAYVIQKAVDNAVEALNNGTTALQDNTPLSDDDGKQLLASLQPVVDSISTAFSGVVAKNSYIMSINTGLCTIVPMDIQNYDAAAKAYTKALVDCVPDDLKLQAKQIHQTISDTLKTTLNQTHC